MKLLDLFAIIDELDGYGEPMDEFNKKLKGDAASIEAYLRDIISFAIGQLVVVP